MYRNTYLEVNIKHYLDNVEYLRNTSGKKLIAVLKANAYGIVDHYAASLVLDAGVDLIAVSSLSEALNLRKHGIKANILILSYVSPCYMDLVKENNFSLVTVSFDYLRAIQNDLDGLGIHIKVDTGMNRIGLSVSEVEEAFLFLKENGARIEGIMTHFAKSDVADNETTNLQYHAFERVVKELNYSFKYIHTCNTDAAIHFQDSLSTHVRCGIGLLGYSSYKSGLKPCVSLKSEIINIKKVKEGEGIGYGHRYISKGDGWIATIPIGYADGFFKKNSGRFVYIDGEYAQIIGNICMDQMMVLCKDYHPCGTVVELFGEHIPLEKMAQELEMINYEILVNISDRITRVYKNGEEKVARKYDPRFSEL